MLQVIPSYSKYASNFDVRSCVCMCFCFCKNVMMFVFPKVPKYFFLLSFTLVDEWIEQSSVL
jgi:hypothetical protein